MSDEALEQSDQEMEHERGLRAARKKTTAENIENMEVPEELTELAENGNHTAAFVITLLADVISDIADWFGIPAIPIIGDILDLATGGISLMSFLQIKGGVRIKAVLIGSVVPTLFELLPFGINDLFPSYIVGGLISVFMVYKRVRLAKEKIEAIKQKIPGAMEME